MAADLHIHVYAEGELTEEDFKCFFHNSMGSKWWMNSVPATKVDRLERHIERLEKALTLIADDKVALDNWGEMIQAVQFFAASILGRKQD